MILNFRSLECYLVVVKCVVRTFGTDIVSEISLEILFGKCGHTWSKKDR